MRCTYTILIYLLYTNKLIYVIYVLLMIALKYSSVTFSSFSNKICIKVVNTYSLKIKHNDNTTDVNQLYLVNKPDVYE